MNRTLLIVDDEEAILHALKSGQHGEVFYWELWETLQEKGDVATDPHSAELVRTIIGMAHNFKLEVVAEGVKSVVQEEFLRRNGCDLVQGFLIARPMAVAEFEAFLAGRN